MRFFISLLFLSVILHAFTIDRPGIYSGIFDGGGNGTVVRIAGVEGVVLEDAVIRNGGRVGLDSCIWIENASHVVLRNVTLMDCLYPVYIVSSNNVEVIDSRISSFRIERGIAYEVGGLLPLHGLTQFFQGHGVYVWWSRNVTILHSEFSDTLDGVYCDHGDGLAIVENRFRFGNRYAVHLMYCSHVSIRNNEITGYVAGIVSMYSNAVAVEANRIWGLRTVAGVGIAVFESDDVLVHGNAIYRNYVAIQLARSPFSTESSVVFRRNLIASNHVGIVLDELSRALFVDNTLAENFIQVSVRQKAAAEFRGNFWGGGEAAAKYTVMDWALQNYPQLHIISTSAGFIVLRELMGVTVPGHAVVKDPKPLHSPSVVAAPAERTDPTHLAMATAAVAAGLWLIRRAGL